MKLRAYEITTKFYHRRRKDRRYIFAKTMNQAMEFAKESFLSEGITENILSMHIKEIKKST